MLKLEPVQTCTDEPGTGADTLKPRLISDVLRDLNAQLAPLFDEGRFTNGMSNPGELWPERYRWIACYAVTGNSEGHYIHIDVMLDGVGMDNRHTAHMVGLCKTFQGWEHACQIANAAGRILQA